MISIKGVSKQFRKVRVLNNIDLDINQGDRIALVGSNGAGKTTLIRCLLGEYNYQGSITIDGLEPGANRTRVLNRIGFVPQLSPPLKMPVGQLILFAAGVCHSRPEKMVDICDCLGLDKIADRARQKGNHIGNIVSFELTVAHHGLLGSGGEDGRRAG